SSSKNRATLPRKMRAGVYRGPGRVATESVPVPEIAEGEVLIRVAACGVCGTDLKKIQHGFIAPPQIFGHEVAGTVAAVGTGVRRWKEGDRVVSFHHVPCGACFYCDRRLFSQCPAYKKVGLTAGFDPHGWGVFRSGRRPRLQFPPRSLRRLLLLRPSAFLAMPGLQESGPYGGL